MIKNLSKHGRPTKNYGKNFAQKLKKTAELESTDYLARSWYHLIQSKTFTAPQVNNMPTLPASYLSTNTELSKVMKWMGNYRPPLANRSLTGARKTDRQREINTYLWVDVYLLAPFLSQILCVIWTILWHAEYQAFTGYFIKASPSTMDSITICLCTNTIGVNFWKRYHMYIYTIQFEGNAAEPSQYQITDKLPSTRLITAEYNSLFRSLAWS